MCFDSVGSDYFDFSKNLFLRSFALSSVWDVNYLFRQNASFQPKKQHFGQNIQMKYLTVSVYCTVLYCTLRHSSGSVQLE